MDTWILSYEGYSPEQEGLREALCATGNGYFVTRAALADCHDDNIHYPGTYMAGCYNRRVSQVDGHTVENEDLVNLPNWLPLSLRLKGGDWFYIDQTTLLDYHQQLDLRSGLLIRDFRFQDEAGRIIRWHERRFVSMADPHLGCLCLELTAENWSGDICLRTALDGRVVNNGVARYRSLNKRHLEGLGSGQLAADTIELKVRTQQSGLEISQVARTRLFQNGRLIEPMRRLEHQADWIGQEISLSLSANQPLRIEKIVALYSSRDLAISEPLSAAEDKIRHCGDFEELLADQKRAWRELWQTWEILVESRDDPSATLKLRLHIFHLLQTVSPHTIDQDISVPARGWHGEAYRGHIFWDELFIFPFINYRMPGLTRALLRYRYRRLPQARIAAREAGYLGAMFPWQSGSSGREETQKRHLNPRSGRWLPDNSHRQRHINAAIAYNIWQYVEVTGDCEFLYDYGAELYLEIARFWASIATYNPAIQRYEIHGVMGPDEYHTAYPDAPEGAGGLSNNAYTNFMASWLLSHVPDILAMLPEERRRQLRAKLQLEEPELQFWNQVSRKLRIPFHGQGIISQFEGYERLEEFDWDGYRAKYGDIQRLDRILEAEGDSPNRYQASKQADVLMLFYLFSAEELAEQFERLGYTFDRDLIPRNIHYYLRRTSHGSTLSWVVHSWVLARANRPQAWPLFQQALNADLSDIQGGTTREGIHLGAMASTVDLVQRGLTGIDTRYGVLHFNPNLPSGLTRLTFHLRYRRHLLSVEIDREHLRIYSHRSLAPPITIAYRGRARILMPRESCCFQLLRKEDRLRDENQPDLEPAETEGTPPPTASTMLQQAQPVYCSIPENRGAVDTHPPSAANTRAERHDDQEVRT